MSSERHGWQRNRGAIQSWQAGQNRPFGGKQLKNHCSLHQFSIETTIKKEKKKKKTLVGNDGGGASHIFVFTSCSVSHFADKGISNVKVWY